MFYDTLLENTRILAAWDQYKTSGPRPAGFEYETAYACRRKPEMGWGKVTVYTAIKRAVNIVGYVENTSAVDWRVYPNSTAVFINIDGIELTNSVIQIFDLNGKLCSTAQDSSVIAVSGLNTGTYLI